MPPEAMRGDTQTQPRGDMRSQLAMVREKILGATESTPVPGSLPEPRDREVTAGEHDEDELLENEELEGESDDSGEESPEVEIKTLTDLAAAIEADPEFIYGLEMAMGDELPAMKIGAIKDRLQELERTAGSVESAKRQLDIDRQQAVQWAAQIGQAREQISQEADEARYEMRAAEAEFERIDWDELRRLDPGRAAMEKQDLVARYGAAKERITQAEAQQQQINQSTSAQARAYNDAKLLERIPEWQDQSVAQAEAGKIVEHYATQYGFTENEFKAAVPWQYREIMRDAYLYRQLQAGTKASAGKAPAGLTGGRTLKVGQAQKAKVKELAARARKTRSRPDKIAAVRALLDQNL